MTCVTFLLMRPWRRSLAGRDEWIEKTDWRGRWLCARRPPSAPRRTRRRRDPARACGRRIARRGGCGWCGRASRFLRLVRDDVLGETLHRVKERIHVINGDASGFAGIDQLSKLPHKLLDSSLLGARQCVDERHGLIERLREIVSHEVLVILVPIVGSQTLPPAHGDPNVGVSFDPTINGRCDLALGAQLRRQRIDRGVDVIDRYRFGRLALGGHHIALRIERRSSRSASAASSTAPVSLPSIAPVKDPANRPKWIPTVELSRTS